MFVKFVVDIGWKPYIDRWLSFRAIEAERIKLSALFQKYLDSGLELVRKLPCLIPTPAISRVKSLCAILEGMLEKNTEKSHEVNGK